MWNLIARLLLGAVLESVGLGEVAGEDEDDAGVDPAAQVVSETAPTSEPTISG